MSSRPKRPYLLRALYDWIVDGGLTPYLLVAVDSPDVQVPVDYVSEGKIVLNLSPAAVRSLEIDTDEVSFDGRFGGKPFPVRVPMPSVVAVYAKESGEGMMFDEEYASDPQADSGTGPQQGALQEVPHEAPHEESNSAQEANPTEGGADAAKHPSKAPGSHLKIIK